MNKNETLFWTKQKITWHPKDDGNIINGTLKCFSCPKIIGLNHHSLDGAQGLAYMNTKISKYVCINCLKKNF